MKLLLENFIRNVSWAAAQKPLIAAGCFIVGLIAVFIFAGWLGNYSAFNKAKKEYETKTAANEKAMQTALSEAEKAAARSRTAEDKANEIIKANSERAANQTKKDAAIDTRINESVKEGEKENEKIKTEFDNDLRRINAMSGSERAEDICSRLKRLAETNPNLAQIQCE